MKKMVRSFLSIGIFFFITLKKISAQIADSSSVPFDSVVSPEFNLFWSSAKVITALSLTLILLVVVVWLLKKIMQIRSIPGMSDGAISLLEVRFIAPKKAVALVRVLDRILIVGLSDNSMTTLGELTPEEIDNLKHENSTDPGIFRNILDGLTGKKKATSQ
ncbi:hypothetical protein ES708_30681 [subsurface metagenome]